MVFPTFVLQSLVAIGAGGFAVLLEGNVSHILILSHTFILIWERRKFDSKAESIILVLTFERDW